MADSDKSINHVMKMEGGYSNHPDDPGKATNFGITQKTFNSWHKAAYGLEAYPVQHISKGTARVIYTERYWTPLRLNECDNQKFATILFDQAVNQGLGRAVRRAQVAINFFVRDQRLAIDGKIGSKTLLAMSNAKRSTMMKFVTLSQLFYVDLTVKRPRMIVFLGGWLKRTHHLFDIVLAKM